MGGAQENEVSVPSEGLGVGDVCEMFKARVAGMCRYLQGILEGRSKDKCIPFFSP